jgi:hypothetical protein
MTISNPENLQFRIELIKSEQNTGLFYTTEFEVPRVVES